MVAAAKSAGFIESHCLYTIKEAGDRLGLGVAALRSARRKGLRVLRFGHRRYVHGATLIDWLNTVYSETNPPGA